MPWVMGRGGGVRPGHVQTRVQAALVTTDAVVRVRQLLYLVEDSFPPELDTELLRQLRQQRLTKLESRDNDLQILRA